MSKVKINMEEFQIWYEQNSKFYDEKNIEDLSEAIEDYKKWKTMNLTGN